MLQTRQALVFIVAINCKKKFHGLNAPQKFNTLKIFLHTIFKKISWPTLHYQRSIYSIGMDINDCWATHVDSIKYNTVWSGTAVQKTDSGWQVCSSASSQSHHQCMVATSSIYLFVQCFRPCGHKLKLRAATIPALLQSLSWFFFMALTWNLTVSHPCKNNHKWLLRLL